MPYNVSPVSASSIRFIFPSTWAGHYGFEHNRPATFKHPLYSLMGDWVMFWQMLSGKLRF